MTWRDSASCIGLGFAFDYDMRDDYEARRLRVICRECPVLTDCATAVVGEEIHIRDHNSIFTIRAGLRPGERDRIYRNTDRDPAKAVEAIVTATRRTK